MDKRKDSIHSMKICRFCLTQDVPMASLYDKKRKVKNAVNLPIKILSCVSIEVFPSDKMPTFICERCKYFMSLFYDFKHICRQADEAVLHFVQENKPFKPIPWPESLSDAYQNLNDIGIMKTVVEDGTTVQVSQDMSDDEDEDDENVYNVKINDGTVEVSKTCVKIVASKEGPEDESRKQLMKGLEERCWGCDECDCAFPLQQMLQLHKMQKHRHRKLACDQCDAKFFCKYSLDVHKVRHSKETPFECVACGKRFKRHILLKRHEKLVHACLERQECEDCPASFLSREELAAHSCKRRARPFMCLLCDKKFIEKSTLHKHVQSIHSSDLKFACEYCPERFSCVSKLSRHVRTHAGERPYPCKYCDKSFVKSHHFTRHVRMKHREEERARSGAQDAYRCEQCEVTFANADELMYHSAIHATETLICPLCQEKFANVDEVTAHVKSHVNGTDFICDICDLAFASKEKLDNHLMLVHEDEIHNDIGQDESSMEADDIDMEAEEDDDNSINVKEEDDHMIVEIKKADEFLLKPVKIETEDKLIDHSNSEESDSESTYTDQAVIEPLATVKKITQGPPKEAIAKPAVTVTKATPQAKPVAQERAVVRKTEEIKHRVSHESPNTTESPVEKKEKSAMAQVIKVETANDKSLRLLEKELQDLKRTNSRSEVVKTPPVKSDTPRGRGRPPLHSSTPKLKPMEEKKTSAAAKTVVVERKPVERKVITKENKEPKVVKETKSNIKEEKDTNKSVIKNGLEKSGSEEGIRRSTRPSKIKDYAKMIRVNTQDDSDSDEMDDDDEYTHVDKSTESVGRVRGRRSSVRPRKSSPAPVAPPVPAVAVPPRKRGRPRKEPPKEVPPKVMKTGVEPEETEEKEEKKPVEEVESKSTILERSVLRDTPASAETDESQDSVPEPPLDKKGDAPENTTAGERKSPNIVQDAPPSPSKLVSPTGQALKKVPIRSLPPGVKPLPLPLVGRSMPSGELCEMQIGKKVVKVQKIIMTKAEVQAMAKKGLVEMKDGTMVLKQGVKLPNVEAMTAKPVTTDNESPSKKEKATPTRCDFGDD